VLEQFNAIMVNPGEDFEEHNIKVFVNKLREINEPHDKYENNEKQEQLMVVHAYLEVVSNSHSPLVPNAGENVTINLTLNCTGIQAIRNTTILVYFDDILIENFTLGSIEPGEQINLSFEGTAFKGVHEINIDIVRSTWIERTQWMITINELVLEIAHIELSELIPTDGNNVTIIVTLTNAWNQSAKDVMVKIFVDDALVHTIDAGIVEPHGSVNLSFTWTAVEGNHTIKVDLSYQHGSDQMVKGITVGVDNEDDDDGGDDGFIPGFGVTVMVGAVAVAAAISMVAWYIRKKPLTR